MNIAVFGAKGRVGSAVVRLAKSKHNVMEIDKDYVKNELPHIDAVIDFSSAAATNQVCDFCKTHTCPLICGVTGQNAEQQKALDELKNSVIVIQKSNFSKGVETLATLCKTAIKMLPNYDCEIIETHRKGKADAPSGTAKTIACVIAQEKGSFSQVVVHSIRAGSNFGKHEIIIAGNGESISIIHQAENVDIFAQGALYAAETLYDGKV